MCLKLLQHIVLDCIYENLTLHLGDDDNNNNKYQFAS